jgi:hypothetical protein
MSLENKDRVCIAEGRVYGSKGIALIYRIFNGICTVSSLATAIYFILINEYSPIKSLNNSIPEAMQHAPDWFYFTACGLIGGSMFINAFLYRILEFRTKQFMEKWNKTNKLPAAEPEKAQKNDEKTSV